ncbi:MAG TPA: M23 family metallopeptidase [Candidatus Hydrogenedentes bacterium]|nr:M23 family metallopeptidase [Candidatus Hydrogenedentota bacterium]HRT19004.1 M23 family metallopeptidase [Candidatus Hydrogenedentota bacterium]HRT65640.1 M23 family metallopeptidase [Candidatus Hydrogenedentota bacterium]
MIAAVVLLMSATVSAHEEPYAWPLELPRAVTGTFGEYRGGRFHAGIDLMTGQNGRPVHAPADGYVMRVTCSPWGYGRALYLQLADGHVAVLGHLDGFAPGIAEYVRAEQHARERYTVELTPDPSRFQIKKGEHVAFSGSTGTVDPHLHYEIRDADNRPVNPRGCGVQWPDVTPPTIRAVLVVPGTSASTVNGDFLPAILKVRRTDDGSYVCGPVKASGRVVFGLDTIDPANNGNSRLGVYRIATTVDGVELFRIQFDRFSYDDRQNEWVSYYPFLMSEGAFLLQWRWPGNVCDIFRQTERDGWFDVPDRSVEVVMESSDVDGNAAAVRFLLEPDRAEEASAPVSGKTGKGKIDIECVNTWLVVSAVFTEPEPDAPRLFTEGTLGGSGQSFRRIDAKRFRVAIAPDEESCEIVVRVAHERIPPFEQRIHVFRRGDPERVISAGETSIAVKPDSPYGTMYLRAFPAKQHSASPLPLCGEPLRLWPAAMPVDRAIRLAFPSPEGNRMPGRVSVYRDTGSRWSCCSEPGIFAMDARMLGVYALMEDNKPPILGTIQVSGTGKRPKIRCEAHETGSGIAEWRLTCNGKWLLSEYDPARNVITWEQDEDLPEGPRAFSLQITDKAGNQTTVSGSSPSEEPPKKGKTVQPKSSKRRETGITKR